MPNSQRNRSGFFIVYGHDSALRTQVELFMKNLEYEPVVLFKQPSKGSTIIEKIEREANDVAFAIVLYTSCDLGNSKEDAGDGNLNSRARQNVVFEHGYMCALLNRRNVSALVESGIEIPGDISGIVYIYIYYEWYMAVGSCKKDEICRLGY